MYCMDWMQECAIVIIWSLIQFSLFFMSVTQVPTDERMDQQIGLAEGPTYVQTPSQGTSLVN